MANNIPQGYKQTELGIVPEDWDVKILGNIGTFSKGSGVSRTESNTGKIPCVRYGELYTHHNDYIKTFNSFISSEVAKNAKMIKCGDVLFAASGETKEDIGKSVAFVGDFEAFAGGDIIILSTNGMLCDAKYIGYASNSLHVVKQKAAKAQGDAVVHITSDSIKNIKILLPPLSEQKAIAEALSDVDELITALDKKIAKKRLIKQGTMQELLTGKKRLPGFTDEWVEKKVKDIFKVTRGYVLSTNKTVERPDGYYKYPVYSSQTQNNGIMGYYSEYLFNEAITWTTDGANAGEVNLRRGKFYCTNVCGVLINEEGYSNDCIASIINMVAKSHVSYIGNPKLMNNVMAEINICIPSSIEEQQAIATILSDMDKEIADLEAQREKYRLVKSGMMQKLLTGEIRLKKE